MYSVSAELFKSLARIQLSSAKAVTAQIEAAVIAAKRTAKSFFIVFLL